jgi:hypothetical protein
METNVSNVAKKDTGQINAKVIKTGIRLQKTSFDMQYFVL